ncbi:MAG: fused MFS/spermidine synthase [Burkholderiales bacterium]
MHDEEPPHARPFVREELDSQSLHFSDSAIQSRMQLREPDALALEYTRTMMGLLMFEPQPARIAMIGLGGGSLAKFCHRHLPCTDLTVVEINPHVIALRERFRVPPDDTRFRVVLDDGAHFVASTHDRFDVLMVDAFDAERMPEVLGTRRFYDDCADVLQPGGLLVVNLHANHPHVPVYLDRMSAAIGGALLRVNDRDGSNAVVFARRGRSLAPMRRTPPAGTHLEDAFSRIAQALLLRQEGAGKA